jgi:HK97 family phage major capsid protein
VAAPNCHQRTERGREPIKLFKEEKKLADDSNPQEIKLDFSGLKEVLEENNKNQIRTIIEELSKFNTEGKQGGKKGYLRSSGPAHEKLIENLKEVGKEKNPSKLTEQWTVVIPNYTTKETSAGLRDYVWVDELLKNETGDVANIPYVKDADFEILSSVGDAFAAETTDLVSSVTTTLYEAGLWTQIGYNVLERINQNLLDVINETLAKAAVRAEDAKIITLIAAGTSTNFAGDIGRKTGAAYFYSTNIAQGIRSLINAGKKARPSECVLYLTSYAYGALLEELTTSEVFATADPQLVKTGEVEAVLGVNIVVGGYTPSKPRTAASTGTADLCFMMRGKRAVALAPKRDLLIETDKAIETRKLKITASHTFGIKILDFKEIVRIWTSHVD